MIRVLFVCTGNICRSPMAEGIFIKLVRDAGLEGQISADSAGTTGYHEGEPAHPGTIRVLKQHGIDYDGRSRPLERRDFNQFDYVIVMDNSHLAQAKSLSLSALGTAKVARLLDYTPYMRVREVPDPYYDDTFEEVYGLVLEGVQALLEAIRKDHNL